MTLDTFPNAKPILLGDDTHAAVLDGSVDLLFTDLSNIAFPTSTGSIPDTPIEAVIITTPVTITKAVNEVRLRIRIVAFTNTTIRIRRGGISGAIVGGPTFVGPSGQVFVVNDSNLPIGNTDYVATAQRIGPVAASVETYTPDTLPGVVLVSEIDDTHVANLTGSNTQKTHEQEELPS